MRRRRALQLTAASLAGLAGCAGGDGDPTDDPGSDPTDTTSGTGTDSTGTDGTPHGTLPPGSDPGDYPGFPRNDGVDRVVWARDVDDPSGRVSLAADLESTSLPDVEGAFTLHNRSDRTFSTNFYHWTLYRFEADRWHYVAPRMWPQPLHRLSPGGSHTWEFAASTTAPEPVEGYRASSEADVDVAPLGGGTYAFAIAGWFETQTATPTHEHQTAYAAQFQIDGPDLALEPSSRVRDTTRDGATVSVDARLDDPSDAEREATFVLTRTPDADDARELVTEQVYGRWPLRDALAVVEDGVDEVRVRSHTSTHPAFGVQDDEPAVRYDGSTWTASVENVESESG
jgi:hypothetical protein